MSSISNYTIRFVAGTLTITPAPLIIVADNQSVPVGSAPPRLTARYAGFVNGDTPADLSAPVQLDTLDPKGVPPGAYPITASGATSSDYRITFFDGTLTVISVNPPATPAATPGNDPGGDPGNDPGNDPGGDSGNDPGGDPPAATRLRDDRVPPGPEPSPRTFRAAVLAPPIAQGDVAPAGEAGHRAIARVSRRDPAIRGAGGPFESISTRRQALSR